MKQCKMCLNSFPKLAKSHIIPHRAIALAIASLPMEVARGEHVKRSPIGPYDDNILCLGCEAIFNHWDSYGLQVMKEVENNASNPPYSAHVVVEEHARFIIFLLSILWRAHVSSKAGFSTINLGIKHANLIKKFILGEAELNEQDYPVMLSLINWDIGGGIVPPPRKLIGSYAQGRLAGYRLWVGNLLAFVLVDNQARDINSPYFTYNQKPKLPLLKINCSETLEVNTLLSILDDLPKPFSSYLKTSSKT